MAQCAPLAATHDRGETTTRVEDFVEATVACVPTLRVLFVLLFVVVLVYPFRMVFAALFNSVSGGRLPDIDFSRSPVIHRRFMLRLGPA